VHRKACSNITCETRLMTKASKTMAAVKVMCPALNKMSFFISSSEAVSASARARVKVSTRRDDPIKLQPSPS
jgi:hypothetical protein